MLLDLLKPGKIDIQSFVALLADLNYQSRQIKSLFGDNTRLLARKIIESSAHTGEHYLARNFSERWDLFKSAFGGGALTGLTTFFKILIYSIPASPFWAGIINSMNYCFSFLGLQALGLTLATKQPAMTAATLAGKMRSTDNSEIVEEVIHLIRSQTIAVFGNLSAVIPAVILVGLAFAGASGDFLMTPEKALKSVHDISLLGMTPIYAAFTGVLLFASSVFAGWFHNWMLERKLPQALQQNRTLIFTFGKPWVIDFSGFVKRNSAGWAANLSLGLMLGMSPVFAKFLGLPFDVRHVTLSTGSLTAATLTLGLDFFQTWDFWNAVLGIASMGFLNILVSFSLAMAVALKSQKISPAKRKAIIKSIIIKILKNPRKLN